ncbi:MAG: hypothetical protein ACLFR1_12085 [Spirochaetia bacterium]
MDKAEKKRLLKEFKRKEAEKARNDYSGLGPGAGGAMFDEEFFPDDFNEEKDEIFPEEPDEFEEAYQDKDIMTTNDSFDDFDDFDEDIPF